MIDPERKKQLDEQMEQWKAERDAQKGWMQRRFGCIGSSLIWLVIFIVGSTATYTVFDALESPWAYTWFGSRPALVGEWVGAFTTPGGMRGIVYVNLQHPYHAPSSSGTG